MSNADLYSDGTYSNNNPNWHSEDSEWKSKEIFTMIEKNSLLPNSIVEVGCGFGGILANIQSKLSNINSYVGYDVSGHAIENAKLKQENHKIKFINKDILKEDVFFDLLLCIDVVEHIENPYEFLRELKDKSNFKIFHFPLDMNALAVARSGRMLEVKNTVGHINYYTKDLALEILKDCGYEVIDSFYTTGSIKSKNKSTKNAIIKPIRRLGYFLNKDLFVRLLGGFSLLVLAK
jgi:2-polyprenyl-3-methyl-5-hydroxy-6-metoxy-1,4-benzoquinol methylase